ncbi:MAG: hypothetical protein KDK70_35875 [Myxococcales bacterium]|nr:hypothetical protein [Myxococcales bacterium]
MRRLRAPTTLALTLVAAAACSKPDEPAQDGKTKTAKAEASKPAADGKAETPESKAVPEPAKPAPTPAPALVELVPEGAKALVVIDMGGLVGSELYKQQSAALESSPLGKNVASARACTLGPETWTQAVMGVDPQADGAVLVGVEAPGAGKKETLECITAKYKEADPRADWTLADEGGRVVVTVGGGEAKIYGVDDDTLAIAGQPWIAAVDERLAGKGKAAVVSSLAEAMALAPTGKTVIFASLAPDDMTGGMLEGAKAVAGALDFSAGLALSVTASFGDAGAAKAKADELDEQFKGLSPLAAGMGVPQPVLDSVTIEAKDANLVLGVRASAADATTLGQSLMSAFAPEEVAMPAQPLAEVPAVVGP